MQKPVTVNLLGIDIFALRMEEVLHLCEEHIAKRLPLLLGVVNVAKAINCRKDKQLRKNLADANVVLADGSGIVWLSKLMGKPLPERVAGIDIMYKLFEKADEKHYRVYLLGATDQVIDRTVDVVKENYRGLQVAGYRNGYFGEAEEQKIAQDIRDSVADILLVGMPSPKKENFLSRWRGHMNVPVCHGVGGSFDIVAGVTKRAPQWIQDCGMEWFYRLIQEPRRMWKRYLVTNSIFLVLSIKAIFQARLKRILSPPSGK